jgi:hypothetical protein
VKCVQNESPPGHERLLVSEREPLAGVEGAERGFQSRESDEGVHHDVDIGP